MNENHQHDAPILDIRDLRINIKIDEGILTAVRGVDFEIKKGETLGLVGESGCGKSLTSKAILGINDKKCTASGEIIFDVEGFGRTNLIVARPDKEKLSSMRPGDIAQWMQKRREQKKEYREALKHQKKVLRSVRGKQISMIFQEPMVAFSPMYTIGNQISEAALLHITSDKAEAKRLSLEVMKKVGIANAEKRYDQYPHEFSGGMLQRALIAMALVCNPKLLIADEPTTALDVTIQAQILELMKELQKDFGMSILFITHDLGTVARMCDRVAVMYLGRIVETAPAIEIYKNPQHPYTQGLIGSVHKIGTKGQDRLFSIEGTVPLALNLPAGCGFYERCHKRIEGVCNVYDPSLIDVGNEHQIACFACTGCPNACKKEANRNG